MTREESRLHVAAICAACRFGTHSPEFVEALESARSGGSA